jgi:hypothetical protein
VTFLLSSGPLEKVSPVTQAQPDYYFSNDEHKPTISGLIPSTSLGSSARYPPILIAVDEMYVSSVSLQGCNKLEQCFRAWASKKNNAAVIEEQKKSHVKLLFLEMDY